MDINGITFELLKSYFHLPLFHVTCSFGFDRYEFEKKIKSLGINNWPSRKIIALDKIYINYSELLFQENNSEESDKALIKYYEDKINETLQQIQLLYSKPQVINNKKPIKRKYIIKNDSDLDPNPNKKSKLQ